MRGDVLARGAKSASFQVNSGRSALETDLKLFSAEAVQEKYGIDADRYKELIDALNEGRELPDLHPQVQTKEPARQDTNLEVSEHPGVKQTLRPSGWRGNAFGESLLVYRVEEGHSSGLIIPEGMKERSAVGFIKSVGEKAAAAGLREGMHVLFDKFAAAGGDLHLFDEEGVERECLLLKHYDVLLTLTKVSL